jgi:hypothetical protein
MPFDLTNHIAGYHLECELVHISQMWRSVNFVCRDRCIAILAASRLPASAASVLTDALEEQVPFAPLVRIGSENAAGRHNNTADQEH